MRTFADRGRHTPRSATPICTRCNQRRKAVELVLQARTTRRPKPGTLGTRGRRLCEPCALELFEAMERLLDEEVADGRGAAAEPA